MANWTKRQRDPRLRQRAKYLVTKQCAVCGSTRDLQLDHIVNLAAGGTDTIENVQWLCRPHHAVKTEAERRRGMDLARERRGSLSKRYRDLEQHPGLLNGGNE